MGNLLSTAWRAVMGPPEMPDVVLVPPLFKPAGVSGRSLSTKSAYQTAFRPPALKYLMRDYFSDGTVGRVLLSPPGSGDVLVSARVASGASAGPRGGPGGLDSLDARVALRWQPVAGEPGTFAEVKAGAVGVLARCSVMHSRSGAGAFALASTAGDTQVGLRLSGQHLGVGLALLGDGAGGAWGGRGGALGGTADAKLPPHVAWAVARAGRLTFGIERRPVLADPFAPRPPRGAPPGAPPPGPLAALRSAGLSAAVAFRSAPPGRAAAFTSILEVTRGGDLVLSFVQHMAVRRRVKNPFEEGTVVGITNYIDLGLRLAAPLARERAAAAAGAGPAFELAAAWQLNKNVLAKAKLGSHVSEYALAFKSWWNPAATFAVCASRRVGDRATRYGAWMAVDNVGTPRFERADPAAAGPAAVRRYIATQREAAAAAGERPMAYVAAEPPGAAGPPPAETRL